jgi:hypothetical protein
LEDHAADVAEALWENSPRELRTCRPGEAYEDTMFFDAEKTTSRAEVENVGRIEKIYGLIVSVMVR